MNAKVAVLTAPETLEIEERPVDPGDGEVLVKVSECGICGSDLKMYSGKHPVLKPPLVMGHEFFGTVEEVGSGVPDGPVLEHGALVTIVPPIGCGHCYNCLRELPYLCEQMVFVGGQLQGGLSELVPVPSDNLLAVDPAIPAELRVLIEPLTVGVHAARRGAAVAGDQVLIIGAGPIGVFTALALRHRGVEEIVLADLSDERLELARRLGAGETVNSSAVELTDYIREAMRPEGVDVAFECVGSGATAAQALASTCKGGRAVLVGIAPEELAVDGVTLQRGERSLVGVQMYERDDFHEAMAILAGGGVEPSPDLFEQFELTDVAHAFSTLKQGPAGSLKTVVRM